MDKENKEQFRDNLSSILDIIICLLLFIMSLYKGGFYKADTAFSNIVICAFGIIMLIVKLVRNIKNNSMVTKSWIIGLLDSLMVIMPICYLMPVVFKTYASIEGSITEFFTYLNFSIIYFIVRSTKNKNYYINTIIVIGTVLSILGIDELTTRSLENVFATISVSYVSNQTARLAATLQYANVTALVMLLAAELCMYKIIKTFRSEENGNKYKLPLYTFLLILLSSCTFLTSSRMASILLTLVYILVVIYLIRKKQKNILTLKILSCLPLSIIITDVVERNVASKEYNNVAISFLVIFALIWLIEVILKKWFEKIFNNIKIISIQKKSKIKIILVLSLVIVSILTVMFFINAPLRIRAIDDEKQVVGRNIYCNFMAGENTVELKIKEQEKYSEYKIYIYEVYGDFSRKCLLEKKDFNIEKNKEGYLTLTGKINVKDNIKNLRVSTTLNKGSISINSLKINNKNVVLSYYCLPDTLIFKLKDTFIHDQNNKLRMEYYKDSIDLIKLSPIVGIGGEGFMTRYQEVQDRSYISSEAHSGVLQIGVETGIFGMAIFIMILVITIYIMIKAMKIVEDKDFIFILLILLISYIITSLFDISMSFQLLVLMLAIIIGISSSYYFEKIKETKDTIYTLDNKSNVALINICVLTTALVFVSLATYYSYNIYRASLINVELANVDAESETQASYTGVNLYEQKLLLDKYNVKYALKLNELYSDHIKLLSKLNITEGDKSVKKSLENEILEYTIRQKYLIDNLIENDYYDKYSLNDVAKCYFENFMVYAKIYEKNFTTREVAYAFYLGYAMKLTDRINQIGPNNKVAQEMVKNIYEDYYESLSNKNKYIKSEVIESVIKDIKTKMMGE